MENFNVLIVVAWILFGILLTPLMFILFDLAAGIRKAKKRNESITSDKWKRTVDKVARYYNALLAIVFIDCLQISLIWYLDTYHGNSIPIFPVFTLLGAIGIGLIEVKSILERAEDKVKYIEVGELFAKIMGNKSNPEEIAKAVAEYMNKKEEETK